jgi:hypothetical protein
MYYVKKRSLKILKHLYTNIFYHESQQCTDINWTLVTVSSSQSTVLAYRIMILDHKSFRKCVCDFAATLTRSNINIEFVYLCIRSKDFAPISTISYYSCKPTMYWYKLDTWRFPVLSRSWRVLSTVAEIDTLSIENCQVKICTVCISI